MLMLVYRVVEIIYLRYGLDNAKSYVVQEQAKTSTVG